jgi:ABC-type lipoprotein release transport system permease subunit
LWLSASGESLDAEPVTAALRGEGVAIREVLHAPTMVALRVEQPLVNAGWGALLVLMFLAVALASASGLMLFSHLDARERQTEFALLRTLGTSRAQMQRVVWTGLIVMVICGVALGTLLGWLLGASLLPLMEVVEEGARVTPSLVFTTDWRRLLVSYVILAGVTGLCGLWLTWLTGKLQLHQVLRMGE